MTEEQRQKRFFDEAMEVVRRDAAFMCRELDNNNLKKAFYFANSMLNEMRTSLLTPKNYNILYLAVLDQLRVLEDFLWDEYSNRGANPEKLYEKAQRAGNIVPRLYLLITVGGIFIRSKQAAARAILRDLAEMCKGVQHPTRGLFLRAYLLQVTKDKLPDKGSEYEGEGGSVQDCLDFVLQNFHEMTKLWMRMQSQTYSQDKEKRERERMDLRVLVGTNLFRIANLEGIDEQLYKNALLPRLRDQILGHKDTITQQYLMDITIQVFPDEFHLCTLEALLDTCLHLQPGVDLQNIAISLMDRLANYAEDNKQLFEGTIDIFVVFSEFVGKLIQAQRQVAVADSLSTLKLMVSLLNLALRCYPDRHDYVDSSMGLCVEKLRQDPDSAHQRDFVRLITQMLTIPTTAYKNVLIVLGLENYLPLFEMLPYMSRKSVALGFAKSALKFGHHLTTLEEANRMFAYLRPLLQSEEDQPPEDELDEEDFEEEQNVVARVVHLFDNDDPTLYFQILTLTRKCFGKGGTRRIVYTLPPLVYSYLRASRRTFRELGGGVSASGSGGSESGDQEGLSAKPGAGEAQLGRIFQHVLEILGVLSHERPEQALRLHLQCGVAADECCMEKLAYEFLAQAFFLYEEEISDSKTQLALLEIVVGTLGRMTNLSAENYDTLSTKACQYSAKLLKKPDQCRAAYKCSHLFWKPNCPDHTVEQRVLECLQRSLKLADNCMPQAQFPLFVEILNKYLYHFNHENEKVTAAFLSKLLDLIETNVKSGSEGAPEELRSVQVFYDNTLAYIQAKKATDARYRGIGV